MIATSAPTTVCPRCGKPLQVQEATAHPGPPGYPPVLTWRHRSPDGGKCVVKGGAPPGYMPTPSARGQPAKMGA